MVTLVIQEMSKEFPSLMETLVHERDQLVFSSPSLCSFSDSLIMAYRED